MAATFLAFELVRSYLWALACTGQLYMNFVADLFHLHTHDGQPRLNVNHSLAYFRRSIDDDAMTVADHDFDSNGHRRRFVNYAVEHDGFEQHSCSRDQDFLRQSFVTVVYFLRRLDICDDHAAVLGYIKFNGYSHLKFIFH